MIRDVAIKYHQSGLEIFPCNKKKEPLCVWTTYQFNPNDFNESTMIGLRLGGRSKVMCIDFDLKNTVDENLMRKYKEQVDESIIQKCMIQSTMSGGWHLVFKTDNPDRNRKYAMNTNGKVIIESRGNGGYIIVYPSIGATDDGEEGYYKLHGRVELDNLNHLSDEEADSLICAAMYFDDSLYNRVYTHNVPKAKYTGSDVRKTPWEDYDDRCDFDDLITGFGWSRYRENGQRVYYTRPDKKHGVSGDFHKGMRLFKSMTSNGGALVQDTAYRPFAVYALLKHNGDFSAAAKELYDYGYGDRLEKSKEAEIEKDNPFNDVFDKIMVGKDLEDYYSGKIQKGKSTGSYIVDRYFKFKENEFNTLVGHTNVGKTFMFKYLMTLGIVNAGMKFMVCAAENKPWDFCDDMISFVLCDKAKKVRDTNIKAFQEAHDLIFSSITFIKPSSKSIFDIMDIAKRLNDKQKYDAILIDPLNGFKLDPKLGMGVGHEYHQNCGSELLSFANNVCSVYLNTHTTVDNQRKAWEIGRGGERKRKIPSPTDAENGGSYANKADSSIAIDRIIDGEPEEQNVTKMWVKKIRTRKLGGNWTPNENPVKFTFNYNQFGFNISDNDTNEGNPLLIKSPLNRRSEEDIYACINLYEPQKLEDDFLNNTNDPF